MTSTTQKTIILKRCGQCPDFASLTLAFALQLRKSTENPKNIIAVFAFGISLTISSSTRGIYRKSLNNLYGSSNFTSIYVFIMISAGSGKILVIQGVSRLVDISAGGDFLGICDQKSSYKHVSDFGRLWSYDRLKLRR